MKKIRTRFSPSPTGLIHLGNARTALFANLFAEKESGAFILRIEDTDVARSEEQYVNALKDDLHWLYIDWQEGPDKDGPFGPYWQSQRHHIYVDYYHQLEMQKKIYPCFCTDEQLAVSRKVQLARGEAPRYAGTCELLTEEEIKRRIANGEKHAWRFKVTKGEQVDFNDLVKGAQHFNTDDLGDFIVRRADGTAPFLFCNAIDDAVMSITHVLRGDDHLANTPRQILILRALNLRVPHYGHLSMITGDDGSPLSKRNGSVSVQDMRRQGYLPLAIINYLARLGHSFDIASPNGQALLNFGHLAFEFSVERLSRSPARFDKAQLLFWQKLAVEMLDKDSMWRWLGESIKAQVPENKQTLFIDTVRNNIVFPHDALIWAKNFFHESAPLDAACAKIIVDAGEQFFVEAEQAVNRFGTDYHAVTQEMKNTLHVQGKKLFMPLRIALTGRVDGPGLGDIMSILGIEKVKHRLSHAFSLATEGLTQ